MYNTPAARPTGMSQLIIEGVGAFSPVVDAPYVAAPILRYGLQSARRSVTRRIAEFWQLHGHAGQSCQRARCTVVCACRLCEDANPA